VAAEPRRERAKKPRPKAELNEAALEEAALSYLNRFDCSVEKLKKQLVAVVKRRGGEPAQFKSHIAALLERYQRSGLLNDERFAARLTMRLRERGASRRAILMKLRLRGVPASVAEASVGSGREGELESAKAYARRRRLGPHRPETEREANRRRDLAALARAGFDHDTAVRAIGYGADDDF
jgi:regulatory protein